jgi:hypothetical protein
MRLMIVTPAITTTAANAPMRAAFMSQRRCARGEGIGRCGDRGGVRDMSC